MADQTSANTETDRPVDLKVWYSNIRPTYEGLTRVVISTLENLLRQEKIDFVSVTGRTKTVESFLEKVERKSYDDATRQTTDFSGIRVITFIESDVDRVCNIIRQSFHVYPDQSFDKSKELGEDRVGYRSVHFVCDLGPGRIGLPEFRPYPGLRFEIQVRTLLQHAWAEIEHDRNYKLAGVLPSHLQRRLFIAAGVLEFVDREFTALARDVDEYAKEVNQKADAGNLDIEINTTSLQEYLRAKLGRETVALLRWGYRGVEGSAELIEELRDFGVHTLKDLDAIFTEDTLAIVNTWRNLTTINGCLRGVMMLTDIDLYFEEAWKEHWSGVDESLIEMLSRKYGRDRVVETFNEYDVLT